MALAEDIGPRDVTTETLIDGDVHCEAAIVFREDAVAAGIEVAELVFKKVDPSIIFSSVVKDGDGVKKETTVAKVRGAAPSILKAERTALNFLGRLSGVATITRRFVNITSPYGVKILDTRKTTPLLRGLEKYAVKMGGGENHRMGLYDMVLIKDNHIRLSSSGGDRVKAIKEIVAKARGNTSLKVEIEVENLEEFKTALSACPDMILLDNMRESDIKKAVCLMGKKKSPLLEASGGITLENIPQIAKTGVDFISIGSLTHSVRSIDVSLEIL